VLVRRGSVTVKIYLEQAGGYTRYSVDFNDGVKRRRKRFADYSKAKSEADLVAAKLAAGEALVLGLSGHARADYIRACDLLKGSGMAISECVSQHLELQRKLGSVSVSEAVHFYIRKNPGALPNISTSDAVDSFLKDRLDSGVRAGQFRDLRLKLKKFSEAFRCRLSDVDSALVRDFLAALPFSGRTKNNYRQVIGQLFRFARNRKLIHSDHDVLADVPEVRETPPKRGIFTPDQFRVLLDHAAADEVPFIAISGFAGFRHLEVGRLEWGDISDGYIHLEADDDWKNASRRSVMVCPALSAWLAPYSQASGRVCPKGDMTKRVMKLAKRAGIEWVHNGLRHSFCSYRIRTVNSLEQVALEVGNSPAMLKQHYWNLRGVTTEAAEAWFSIFPSASRVHNQPPKTSDFA
jgi:integrase